MNIGPLPSVAFSAAGAPLSQTSGADVERAKKETAAHNRQATAEVHAESAAGIGKTSEEQQASDRDADGRRLWEPDAENKGLKKRPDEPPKLPQKLAKDPTGTSGNQLDLTG